MSGKTPTLSELYGLAQQLELDKELPVQAARERDHAIAASCSAGDDSGRLLFWLDAVSSQRPGAQGQKDPWLSEASVAALGRLLALFFGFSGMAAFLLTSGRGLVNVFMFLLLFVIVQFLLCLVAAVVMALTLGPGQAPVVLPVNPARLLVARVFPDRRYLREAHSVVRLMFLRYGQELGALFTLGAIAAFFVVLALSDFTFVWGSTFQLSDSLVEDMTAAIASPWSAWLPQATVSSDLIFATRFHPAITSLSPANIDDMRGWWPFLIMAMLCYALLPRLLLWLLSRYFYGRQMRAAITRLPGSERVLARMKTPLVRTQGEGGGTRPRQRDSSSVPLNPGLLLLNWANALTPEDVAGFDEFAAVADGNIVNAGLGSVPEELERLASRFDKPLEQLYVATKSWEPPMADLADFLANFARVPRCTLFLVPLPRKPVSAGRLGDWQVFARALPFDAVDVQALERE
jgi:hypothetical protein